MTDLDAFKQWLNVVGTDYIMRPEKTGATVHHLDELFGDQRHSFLEWAFGVRRTADLKGSQLCRIYEWLQPVKDLKSGKWLVRERCKETADEWLVAHQVEAGQMELIGESE